MGALSTRALEGVARHGEWPDRGASSLVSGSGSTTRYATAVVAAPRLAPTEATRRWAALLQQRFELDPLACSTCHGPMRVVAFITQTSVSDRILTHLRTRVAASL
jgi:hypothetical protein